MLILSVVTATLSWFSIFTRVSSLTLIKELFAPCDFNPTEGSLEAELCNPMNQTHVALMLFLAALLKFVLTVYTIGTKVPAGLFVPNLAIGACLGRAVGIGFELLVKEYGAVGLFSSCDSEGTVGGTCVTPGGYAMVGAVAMLGGVTRYLLCLTSV